MTGGFRVFEGVPISCQSAILLSSTPEGATRKAQPEILLEVARLAASQALSGNGVCFRLVEGKRMLARDDLFFP